MPESLPTTVERRAAILENLKARRAVMAGRTKGRKRRLTRQVYPGAIALSYFQSLRGIIRAMRKAVAREVLPHLKAWLKVAHRHDDDEEDFEAFDDDYAAAVTQAVQRAREQFEQEVTDRELKDIAGRVGRKISDQQRDQWHRQVKEAIGVSPVHSEPWLGPKLASFTAENVSLIGSIEPDLFHRVEQLLLREVTEGTRWEDIAEEIEQRFSVSESRAALIARDQVGKFNGALNELRQRDLGVTRFVWRSSGDTRVRPLHKERDGETYSWAKGAPGDPDDKFPRDAVQCRCEAEPVLDDLLNDGEEPDADASDAPD